MIFKIELFLWDEGEYKIKGMSPKNPLNLGNLLQGHVWFKNFSVENKTLLLRLVIKDNVIKNKGEF